MERPTHARYTGGGGWVMPTCQREAIGVSRCPRRSDASSRGLHEAGLCGAHRDWHGRGRLNCVARQQLSREPHQEPPAAAFIPQQQAGYTLNIGYLNQMKARLSIKHPDRLMMFLTVEFHAKMFTTMTSLHRSFPQ